MNVTGSALVHAEPQRVYDALGDPAVLVRTIPGCESLEALGDDRYRMSVTAGVASIRGTYDGEVALSDRQPPEAFVLRARGSGAPGTVDATVQVRVSPSENGSSEVAYDADAIVGGMVGGVGQRMLASASRRIAADFFAAVDAELSGAPAPAELSASGRAIGEPGTDKSVAPESGTVYRAPARTTARGTHPLVAAATGAGIALAGVLVGWRIGRGHR